MKKSRAFYRCIFCYAKTDWLKIEADQKPLTSENTLVLKFFFFFLNAKNECYSNNIGYFIK